ncbi:TolC family protein [Fluviispira vulneris]|uniref:TolC family protein n=1 Tax=Fluviispira vulneris TaxID=2763012 RepID=UPI001645221D|nr:TolC family protein [Fluviispira vulneris]
MNLISFRSIRYSMYYTISIGICFSSFSEEFLKQNHNFIQSNSLVTTTLSLENAMDMSEQYSFAAKMAEQDENSSEAQYNASIRNMFPTLSVSSTYLQNSNQVNKLIGTTTGAQYGFPDTTSMTGTLNVTQPLVGLIPLFLGVKANAAQARASSLNKNQSQVDARYNGASTFINAQKANQLLKTAESSLQVSEKELRDAEAQYNAGKLTNADLLKFKLNLENSRSTLIQAQTTYKIAMLTLAEAIGVKDFRSISLQSGDKSVFENKGVKIPDLNSDLTPAYALRFDLKAAQEKVEAAKFSKYQTISSYLPTLNFIMNYTRNFFIDDVTVGNTTYKKQDIQDTFSYGLQLNWVLMDWGVRQAQISNVAAQEQKARYNLENLNSQAKIDITRSYLQLKDAVQVLESAVVSVQYAQDVYDQMKARFDNGQVTATDLINSSNDQTTARANLANARGGLDLAWIAFQRSTGAKLTTMN